MRDLDETLVQASRFLDGCGFQAESLDLYCDAREKHGLKPGDHSTREVLLDTLISYRVFMLGNEYLRAHLHHFDR